MLDKDTTIHVGLAVLQTSILVFLLIYAQMLFIVTPRDLQDEIRKSNGDLQLSVEVLSSKIEDLTAQVESCKPSKQLIQLLEDSPSQ